MKKIVKQDGSVAYCNGIGKGKIDDYGNILIRTHVTTLEFSRSTEEAEALVEHLRVFYKNSMWKLFKNGPNDPWRITALPNIANSAHSFVQGWIAGRRTGVMQPKVST